MVKGIGLLSYTSERSERTERAKRKTAIPSRALPSVVSRLNGVGDQRLSLLLGFSITVHVLRPGLCRLDCGSSNTGPLDQTIPRNYLLQGSILDIVDCNNYIDDCNIAFVIAILQCNIEKCISVMQYCI